MASCSGYCELHNNRPIFHFSLLFSEATLQIAPAQSDFQSEIGQLERLSRSTHDKVCRFHLHDVGATNLLHAAQSEWSSDAISIQSIKQGRATCITEVQTHFSCAVRTSCLRSLSAAHKLIDGRRPADVANACASSFAFLYCCSCIARVMK